MAYYQGQHQQGGVMSKQSEYALMGLIPCHISINGKLKFCSFHRTRGGDRPERYTGVDETSVRDSEAGDCFMLLKEADRSQGQEDAR